ncbi:hypothetical protein FHL15_004139 [Xylaria flabelliformis]|uniref:Uncharacterized protein n=1 Tax=Xylaria flabelliformis TaxID=2512241 RepID=A0A553I4C9_9PEZI|nr:hypothetical protein FHL15_004139 [Xylaria flabelliformis]
MYNGNNASTSSVKNHRNNCQFRTRISETGDEVSKVKEESVGLLIRLDYCVHVSTTMGNISYFGRIVGDKDFVTSISDYFCELTRHPVSTRLRKSLRRTVAQYLGRDSIMKSAVRSYLPHYLPVKSESARLWAKYLVNHVVAALKSWIMCNKS